jgi:hypothetical protein
MRLRGCNRGNTTGIINASLFISFTSLSLAFLAASAAGGSQSSSCTLPNSSGESANEINPFFFSFFLFYFKSRTGYFF